MLLKDEKLSFANTLVGKLSITVNHVNDTMWIDKKAKDGKYIWEEHQGWFTKPESQIQRDVARDFPFVAYTIRYGVEFPGDASIGEGSHILATESLKSTTNFYPFSRRFFHIAENRLDRALYQV